MTLIAVQVSKAATPKLRARNMGGKFARHSTGYEIVNVEVAQRQASGEGKASGRGGRGAGRRLP